MRWLIRYPRAMPLGIFLMIFCITVVSVFAIERGEAERRAAELETRATTIAFALERRANASSAYLRAGAALLSTREDLPEADFRRFVSELRLDEDYRGAEGIGWAQVVQPDEIAAFETQLAQRNLDDPPRVHPRPDRAQEFVVPITFLQPDTTRNRMVLGFDLYSEAQRRAAMIQAERNARPTATNRVVLQPGGEAENVYGFVIFMPVFEPAVGGRRLRGFIYSPFSAQDFLSSALELEQAGTLAVALYDGDSREPGSLLASTARNLPPDGVSISKTVTLANNPSLLVVSRAEVSGLSGLAVATLIFGLLVAALLTILIRILTVQALEDEATLVRFEEQASIRNSLTRELNHRVKNTLANVLSILALTRRRAEDVDEFAEALDGRIRALSATHDLLTMSDWGTTPISAVVEAELLPYANAADHTLTIRGPSVELAPNDALSLGLAIHELATNAAKYGALSRPGGSVQVVWQQMPGDFVQLEWLESGGPAVPAERERGFGTNLIERIVAHELRQPVELDFAPEGVRCVLRVPVRQPKAFSLRAERPETPR